MLQEEGGCKLCGMRFSSSQHGLGAHVGNLCYVNAVLQCLCSMSLLMEYLLSGEHEAALHKEDGKSAATFGCSMSDVWLRELDCISLESFCSVLGEPSCPTVSKRTQQDVQEFICVLNELHEALKKVRAQL